MAPKAARTTPKTRLPLRFSGINRLVDDRRLSFASGRCSADIFGGRSGSGSAFPVVEGAVESSFFAFRKACSIARRCRLVIP